MSANGIHSADDLVDVTPDGSDVEVSGPMRALLIGSAGYVKIDTPLGSTVTPYLQAGMNSVKATKIYDSGTTATDIFAVY